MAENPSTYSALPFTRMHPSLQPYDTGDGQEVTFLLLSLASGWQGRQWYLWGKEYESRLHNVPRHQTPDFQRHSLENYYRAIKRPSKKYQHVGIREQLERGSWEEGDGRDGQEVGGPAAIP